MSSTTPTETQVNGELSESLDTVNLNATDNGNAANDDTDVEMTEIKNGPGPVQDPGPSEPSEETPGTSTDSEVIKFELGKFTSVALWSWDIQVDTCAICRNNLMDQCIECQVKPATAANTTTVAATAAGSPATITTTDGNTSVINPDVCTIAWGVCNHAFHFHCITRWLLTREVCPLDNMAWEFQRYGS